MLIYIGVVGYTHQEFDREAAKNLLKQAFEAVRADHPRANICVVSWLTDQGIPGLAYEIAKKRGWHTLAVDLKENLNRTGYRADELITVDASDERTTTFVQQCDVIVRIGDDSDAKHVTGVLRELDGITYEYDLSAYPAAAEVL